MFFLAKDIFQCLRTKFPRWKYNRHIVCSVTARTMKRSATQIRKNKGMNAELWPALSVVKRNPPQFAGCSFNFDQPQTSAFILFFLLCLEPFFLSSSRFHSTFYSILLQNKLALVRANKCICLSLTVFDRLYFFSKCLWRNVVPDPAVHQLRV